MRMMVSALWFMLALTYPGTNDLIYLFTSSHMLYAGMDPKFTEFLRFTGVMILVNQASTSMGVMVSTLSRNPFVAMTSRE